MIEGTSEGLDEGWSEETTKGLDEGWSEETTEGMSEDWFEGTSEGIIDWFERISEGIIDCFEERSEGIIDWFVRLRYCHRFFILSMSQLIYSLSKLFCTLIWHENEFKILSVYFHE